MATAERQGPRSPKWRVRNKDGGIEYSGRSEAEAKKLAEDLTKKEQSETNRYPYRHHGPAVHGDKMTDYLISEHSLREDEPERFKDEER